MMSKFGESPMYRLSLIGLLFLTIIFLPLPAVADNACDDYCIDDFMYCDYDCGYGGSSCSDTCDSDLDQCLSDCNAGDAGGHWLCTRDPWAAATTQRKMLGLTRLECGWFNCSDTSHTRPTSWVDISGGISRLCDDHSDSFYGPEAGEWNMCTANYGGNTNQVSTGRRAIERVDQNWDRWPYRWRSKNTEFTQASICNEIGGSGAMVNPFATIYDLDKCWDKQRAGTIYWPNFNLTATLISGDCNAADGLSATYAEFKIFGSTGLTCSTKETACENQVCADLEVSSRVRCTWYPE